MSKEEFLKIQTCVLKVNIHCDGCKHKVKKILQKIDGVYTTNIDSEQGKVTVSGNVDAATLIKKLTKNGKHAEIWGSSKANNNNQNQMNNQFKNLQIDNGSKGGQNKGQTPKGGGNNQPKGGLQAQNPQFQQLQQMQQLKGLQDLKTPPQFMKDLKRANNNKDQNQKSVKFNMPEDEEFSDDDFDDDDFDDDDDDFDDEVDDIPIFNNKMKPPVLGNGHGGAQMGNIMMNNIMNGQHPQLMKGAGNNGGNGGGNGKGGGGGGGGGNVPVQMNLGGGNQNQGGANGGKKGGNGNNNGGNQNQGGGKGGKNGGGHPNDNKNHGGGGSGQNKNGGGAGGGGAVVLNGNNSMGNGARKGGGMNDGPHGMPNMMPMSSGGKVGPLGANMPMGQMGNLPMGQMNNLAAVQGLPASAMTGGGGGGAAGYFPATTPEQMTENPYYQQQLAAMMMNQQRANGNERFQPMMYARPPPAVNYMPPYPTHPYPNPYLYAPPHGERTDQYAMFSDENTSSCNVM